MHHVDEDGTTLIALFVAMRENGPVCEEIPAQSLGGNQYELLSSPGLALNLARGDIVEIKSGTAPATVVRRGGNFCIQIYADELAAAHVAELRENVGEKLHGTLDGSYRGNLALSVPASAGMASICEVFDGFTARTGVPWYFANVYKNFDDAEDETLLDWWQ
ncbi:DUF4265 domain-containing protein [Pseudoduganella albidiflava]|uniref:DUF4265 domain-containing protein n=1 Tax=Pseudoduganella albidiflava TaxID=321983 RepID=A0A411X2S7_9BURK|nr:DUF4265 domain-containing protein [Pseudoduganella albidiflava]QBI03244.1 DUF4265 domain-containing protein [Pseudoduganella albidiflava]GGY69094.1 hypothetical protein GCM10007387_58950 [Pseudoduganella albidiflava]